MEIRQLSPFFSVTPQITPEDVGLAAAQGFQTIISNRPDHESYDQPDNQAIQAAAERHGLAWHHLPVVPGQISDEDVAQFRTVLQQVKGPVLAFCRTGTRSCTLWALSQAPRLAVPAILQATAAAGYDLSAQEARLQAIAQQAAGADTFSATHRRHEVVVVGGGAGGIAVTASLLKRRPDLDIAIIEPRTEHYYQPGWTLVGGGVFERAQTVRPMNEVLPASAKWYQAAAARFLPERQQVVLEDGEHIGYRILVVAPGLTLDWEAIPGLKESLGSHGVTSNYLFDLAPYTWELVQSLKQGRALFTQPPMPIKCAGAPQKAMYLACDQWRRSQRLAAIEVEFCSAGAALFGVADYVPALMKYVERYGVQLNFQHNLRQVDGEARVAVFTVTDADGQQHRIEREFDLLHVCPPQRAPRFISSSPLADSAGWVDVQSETLQHTRYGDIFALGDCCNTPNAKTAAAVRKQAPVVAENVLLALDGQAPRAIYEGYGSCPLTVERGKIVLAEFGYGGVLQPTFPSWLVNGTQPSRLAWLLKEKLLPWIYWEAMLQGKEWLAEPKILGHRPVSHQAQAACDFKEPRR